MKFAGVKIVTRDVDELVRFYRVVTRLSEIGSEHYAEFGTGGAVLAICSQEASNLFGAGAATAAANRSLVISFEVDDVDAQRERLRPIVGRFVQEPTNQPWGRRAMLFRDPDGNLVQMFALVSPQPTSSRPS